MFFKKKPKKEEVIDIYNTDKITSFANLYCSTLTYEEDKIDISKVPTKYVKNLVYDGYNIQIEDRALLIEFSMCLMEEDGLSVWGDIRLSKFYYLETDEKYLRIDLTHTLSHERVMLSDSFPFKMVSMIYKDEKNNGYYFYAKSLNDNGIYICIYMEFEEFFYMSHVFSNLIQRRSIEHSTFITHVFANELRKFDRISFINSLEIEAFGFTVHRCTIHMIMVILVNNITFIHRLNFNIRNTKSRLIFIGRAASSDKYRSLSDLNKYVEHIMFDNEDDTNREAIFFTDSPILCEYFKDPKKSDPDDMISVCYFMQDMKSIMKNEDTVMSGIIRYIQMDNPALEAFHDIVMEKLNEIVGRRK